MLSPALLASEAVPRYTSYPTSPHFSSAVGAGDYAAALSRLPRAGTLSLYVHVPFCAELCHYCACHTKAVRRRAPIEAYADRLADELAIVADLAGGRKVVHIHWGGGTPSTLGAKRITALAGEMATRFDLADVREHAVELDPRHLTDEIVRALADVGVNRASLGVQEFSPSIQQAIGRIQPFDLVAASIDRLRAAGIRDINLDLMYGLPTQTRRDVETSIALAERLRPARVALFGYAHVPWVKPHQRLITTDTLPDANARLEQARAAHDGLLARGYVAIGLDHFARPDDTLAAATRARRLHRNFQGYTVDDADALIGLGASGIGRLPEGYFQNAPDVGGYSRAVGAGALATARGLILSVDDRLRALIIERLMCDFAVDLDAVAAETGADAAALDAELAALDRLAAADLVTLRGRRIAMTQEGRPFVRIAAAAFDAYLPLARARHSAAV